MRHGCMRILEILFVRIWIMREIIMELVANSEKERKGDKMNGLIEKGYITEMKCGANFSYILNDSSIFSSTEYKVLQNQQDGGLIPCMKMLYNGKVQLYYLTEGYQSFTDMLPKLEAESFLIIVTNILSRIFDVKSNGFLTCQNIDISAERIYVDSTTYKVGFIYLPVEKRIYHDDMIFENEIRTELVRIISEGRVQSSPQIVQLAADLANGMLTLEELYHKMKGGKVQVQSKMTFAEKSLHTKKVRIIAINSSVRVELEINKESFIIGKNTSMVDGVISFNKMISRVHCRIDRRDEDYTITDLQSANGTFVNRIKLQPETPQIIKNGDIIRLANSDFQVSIM